MFVPHPSFAAGVARVALVLCIGAFVFTACLESAEQQAPAQGDPQIGQPVEQPPELLASQPIEQPADRDMEQPGEEPVEPSSPERGGDDAEPVTDAQMVGKSVDEPVPGAAAIPEPVLDLSKVPMREIAVARLTEAALAGGRGRRVLMPASSGAYAPGLADFDREQYDFVAEAGFLDPRRAPLSTFSIDVDTASYSNVRRLLRAGQRPPRGAVRIEELVNYFRYDYPAPTGGRPFSVVAEVSEAPWQPEHQLVMIGLRGLELEEREIPPRNLTFLLDVSGSMSSHDKLPLVVRAMRTLAATLRPEDRVAIVVYAGASGLVLPSTSGAERGVIDDALSRLQAGGSTNGGEGIRLAYQQARRSFDPRGINRVILATDGDFNVGTTSRSDLVELIERERESGVFLTVLGVGTGNLQDASMEQLADHGNGNYAYLDSDREARKVLVAEAGGTLVTVAKDVKIQVEFNPTRVSGYRLIGYENRRLEDRDFNDDRKDAGEIGAGHTVTALYEVVPTGQRADTGDVDPLRYQDRPAAAEAGSSAELLTVKLRFKQPDGERSQLIEHPVVGAPTPWRDASEDMRFAASVATFGMLLLDSEHVGAATWDLPWQLARDSLGDDPSGYRSEFLGLVKLARDLAAPAVAPPAARDDDRG